MKQKDVTVGIPEPLHKRLKALSKATRYSVRVLLSDAVEALLAERETPAKRKAAGK